MRFGGQHRTSLAAGACVALALAGCFGAGGDDGDRQASDYGLAVERISDEVRGETETALRTLNRAADGELSGDEASAELREIERRVSRAGEELDGLTPPDAAAASAADLVRSIDDLALHLTIAATSVRVDSRALPSIARAEAATLLAYQSGFSTLSRAVRSLAVD